MIELVYSNMTERLLDDLALTLRRWRAEGAHPLDPVEIVVPNRNMETWVRLGLAQADGVAANLRFRRIERFIGEVVSEACSHQIKLADLNTVEAAVLAVLLDDELLSNPELQPVCRYLEKIQQTALFSPTGSIAAAQSAFDGYLSADGVDMRRVQLAARIASLFQEYSFSRPEMISTWRGTGPRYGSPDNPFADPALAEPGLKSTAAWQRALWQAVFGADGSLNRIRPPEGGRWVTLDQLALDDDLFAKIKDNGLPPIHIFGVSYVARIFQHLFARLGDAGTLRIYTLNPCAEFWEDVDTEREFFYRLDREINRRSRRIWSGPYETENEDPFGLFEADNPALRYWGRPGREHVRLLGELTDCDFNSAFANPADGVNSGLLHCLQRDILIREPERNLGENHETSDRNSLPQPEISAALGTNALTPPDETIKIIAAPSLRREVEWIADEIWRLVRDDRKQEGTTPLRFSDIAVIVNSADRDKYLPQIETVFAACHNLPNSVSDLPASAGSRIFEAMNLLLELPFGRFTRAEMLTLICHPAVIGNFDDISPEDLAGRVETLGIVFGADHCDHANTYIDEDVYNWDQGIRRLALGAFMTGEKSGDERIFETEQGRWLVEEVSGSTANSAARFGLLARALLADARFTREQNLSFTDWAKFYTAQVDAYLHVAGGADERDRLRLIRSLSKLEAMDNGCLVSGRVASEIARRSIASLGGSRGQYLAEGVVVSSFLPMRAIPFKVVFVLGLGEGLFPASGHRDALDLRAARRRAGDVDSSERDRYMFLETLLCTREKLYLSYVRRDEQTGDPLQPSAVVQELLHMLETGYVRQNRIEDLFTTPPLRRYEDPAVFEESFMDEARAEAKILEIARNLHDHLYARSGEHTKASATPAFEPGSDLCELLRIASPEAVDKLSAMLALPGAPPAATAVTAASKGPGLEKSNPVEAPIYLSLAVLRRFLECPMQGWASAMLGLTELEEDLADREEEDFEMSRVIETRLLREAFLDAAAGSFDPAELYDKRVARLRLAGQAPVGILGRANRNRQLEIIAGWRSCLPDLPDRLHRIRLGRSSQTFSAEIVLDPISLSIQIGGPNGQPREVPVRLSGLTEGLFPNRLTSITLQPKNPPNQRSTANLAAGFRYLLRGIIDHAVLSAAGEAGSEMRNILVCYAGNTEQTGLLKLRLKAMTKERATLWLTAVTSDLLSSTHAYMLPCEAIFAEYYEQSKSLAKKSKNMTKDNQLILGPPADDLSALLSGYKLSERAGQMAGNDWSRFSSLWGPVPSPRSYQPPEANQAAAIAIKRFGPLFEDMVDLKGEGI